MERSPLVCLPGLRGDVRVDPDTVAVIEDVGVGSDVAYCHLRLMDGSVYTVELTAEACEGRLWPAEGAG